MEHTIAFPGLGLEFSLPDTVVQFSIGDATFTIKWYGVMIALGFLLAALYAYKRAPQFGIDRDRMFDVVLVCTLLAFVGARLYFVLFSESRDEYFANPVTILQIWKGGLGIYGGLLAAFLSGLWMCRVRKVNTLAMFDLASLGFLIGQGIGRWGNFFNQEAYGRNTTLPWGMTGDMIRSGIHATADYDRTLPVHPTFLYESLWCLLGFLLLHWLSRKFYKFKGEIFASYLIWYGFGRFFIEGLRIDSLYFGSMRVSQLVAVLAVLGGVVLLFVLHARQNRLPETLPADGAPTVELEPIAGEPATADADTDADGDTDADTDAETDGEPEAATESSESAPESDAPAEENGSTAEETADGDVH